MGWLPRRGYLGRVLLLPGGAIPGPQIIEKHFLFTAGSKAAIERHLLPGAVIGAGCVGSRCWSRCRGALAPGGAIPGPGRIRVGSGSSGWHTAPKEDDLTPRGIIDHAGVYDFRHGRGMQRLPGGAIPGPHLV